MQKLQKKRLDNILNYQDFLKNNSLKQNKFKLKNILFESEVILKREKKKLFLINFNEKNKLIYNKKNDFLKKDSIIYTIDKKYQNYLIFKYKLNYNLLSYLHKILVSSQIKKIENCSEKNIQARVFCIKRKNVIVGLYGKLLKVKTKDFFKNRKFLYGKNKNKKQKIIQSYTLKYLNFRIIKHKNINILSRKLYVRELNEKMKNIKN